MKILFVEDELSKNIPRIIRLFSKYLGKKRIQRLESLEADEYGAEPEEIKAIVEETNLIELDYRFSDALHKVIHHHNDYALFIVDRNLQTEYDFEEVKKIDHSFTDHYFEREGDYLFCKLALLNVDMKTKFYYLTAYSDDDDFRWRDDLPALIEFFKDFKTQNLIEKGAIEKLKEVVEKIPIMKLQYENQYYLEVLRNNIGDKACERFLYLLNRKDSDDHNRISENLGTLRNILESILTQAAKKMNAPVSCWNKNDLAVRNFIWWLTHDETSRMESYKFETNKLLENFLFSIYAIGSDFGSHDRLYKTGYQPTLNTINSLVYALKDVILWFGKIL